MNRAQKRAEKRKKNHVIMNDDEEKEREMNSCRDM